MSNVTVNRAQELYVIPAGDDGSSCLGFDNALNELDRIGTEMVGRGYADPEDHERFMSQIRERRGTLEVYDHLVKIRAELQEHLTHHEPGDDRAVYNLSPQLQGLEGELVAVVDVPGATERTFIVGRSTGWAPCHLEVDPHDSEPGSDPARMEYHSVREIG